MDCSFEETLASLACISTVVVARGLRSTNSTPLLRIVHIHLISFAMRHVPSLGGRYWGKCCFSLKIDRNAMSVLRITFLLFADTIDVQSPTLSRGCCTQLAHLMPSHFPKATFCLLQKDFAVNPLKETAKKIDRARHQQDNEPKHHVYFSVSVYRHDVMCTSRENAIMVMHS